MFDGHLQKAKILNSVISTNSTIISNIRFPSFKRKLLQYTFLKHSKFHSIHITQRSSTSDDRLYRSKQRVTMILLLYPAFELAMDASVVKLALKVLVDRTIIFFFYPSLPSASSSSFQFVGTTTTRTFQ